ncbi:MAG: hypothetical protein B6242_11505 [Anaerolineaceae bacterium 4572_78]|nr:MAG: hypothetical protein B6242_11505 [Anaerolineaceae bacterium 4572_78]
MPSFNHSLLQARLSSVLTQLNKYNIHSELTLIINDKDYTPDIVLYPKRKTSWFDDIIKMKEMPLAAIEIISPTQGTKELTDKFKLYFEAGIPSCWFVQPFPNMIAICTTPEDIKTFSSGDVIDETLDICFPLKDLFE